MKKLLMAAGIAAALFSGLVQADTLELADGSLLEGKFVGSSNGIIMFDTGAGIEAFPEAEVVGIFISSGVKTRSSKNVAKTPSPPASAPPAPAQVTIPGGTRLVIRMSDGIDTRRHSAGHRFRGQLEGAVAIDGITVIPRGTILYGKITQASTGGRTVGSASMAMEFTDVMIDDQLYEIATTGLTARTENEAARTIGRTARASVLGALISGSSGARTGAAVGLGASILTSGASINVPAGTIMETSLRVPLTVPSP